MTFRSDTDLRISTTDKSAIGYGPAPVRPDAEPIWSVPISGKEFDNYVVFHEDLAIIHREYKEVIAVKAESGEQVWATEDPHYAAEMKVEGFYWPTFFECAEGQVLISARRFCVLDANDGSVIMGRTKRDAENYPEPHAYKQYGDWYRKHTGDHWVNRITGQTQSGLPQALAAFQEEDWKQPNYLTNLQEIDFIAGRHLQWNGQAEKDGSRELVCRDIRSGAVLWSKTIRFSAHFSGHPQRPRAKFQTRNVVVVAPDHHDYIYSGEFALLDGKTGAELMRGTTGESNSAVGLTGRILYPPEDARDVLLVHQTEYRPFEKAQSPDGDMEDATFVYLSAIDIATGTEAWNTRDSLGNRYKPMFKNVYRRAGSRILCRTGNNLWVKHTAFNDIRYKTAKPGDYWQGEPCVGGEKLPLAKETTLLAALDHNTGQVLHTRKLPATAEYAGQNDGRLYLREGRKMVCYA